MNGNFHDLCNSNSCLLGIDTAASIVGEILFTVIVIVLGAVIATVRYPLPVVALLTGFIRRLWASCYRFYGGAFFLQALKTG